jgi:acetyltransferase
MQPRVPLGAGRFDPDRLFRPETVLVTGGATAAGERLKAALADAAFAGRILDEIDSAGEPVDLAFIADDPAQVPVRLKALAPRLRGGAVVASACDDLRGQALAAGVRVLGPRSFGLAVPGIGLNGLLAHRAPMPGRVALIGQSASFARSVIDWAEPNGVGFSHVVGIGGNADIGFGRVLDYLARDPGTGAILLEIGWLRDPRLFFSAARAAARLRPIVAIAPGARLRDPSFTAIAGYEAAFARAGILLTQTLGEFFSAAETLTRARPARGEALAVIGNTRAGCRLAADAALACGLSLAVLTPETRQVLGLLPDIAPDVVASGPARPIALPDVPPTRLADVAALLGGVPEVGGVLVVHAPTGADRAAMAALAACAQTIRAPLLAAVLGEATAAGSRAFLASAGLPVFETPEAAVNGFHDLVRNRRSRLAARELPAAAVLAVAPDKNAVRDVIAKVRAEGRVALAQHEAFAVLGAYGLDVLETRVAAAPEAVAACAEAIGFPVVVKLSHPDFVEARPVGSIALDLPDAASAHAAAVVIRTRMEHRGAMPSTAFFLVQKQALRSRELRIRVAVQPVLGPVIGFGPGGGDLADMRSLTVDLPPLNLPLARALILRAAATARLATARGFAADDEAIAGALVRVSQLIIDTPEIAALDIDPLFAGSAGVQVASARITLRPPGETVPELVIPPYPAHLARMVEAGGAQFLIRPIRPEDAEAHAALFARLTPEDVRLRFFSAIRALAPEQILRMTEVDYTREMAFVAVRQSSGETAGAARLVRSDTDGRTGEFAVLVEAAAKHHGLGTQLMTSLIAWARGAGVQEITGQVLAENAPMLAFVARLGFSMRRMPGEEDVMEVRLGLQEESGNVLS